MGKYTEKFYYICISINQIIAMENVKTLLPMVERDEWLHPVADKVADRHNRYMRRMEAIEHQAGSIVAYANGYRYYGW